MAKKSSKPPVKAGASETKSGKGKNSFESNQLEEAATGGEEEPSAAAMPATPAAPASGTPGAVNVTPSEEGLPGVIDCNAERDQELPEEPELQEKTDRSFCDPGVQCFEPPQLLASTIIQSYEGDRGERGEYSGYGVATFVGRNSYEGLFVNGVMHGRGRYRWANGMHYEGEFHYNQITGYGRYEWPDQSFYEGEVLNGVRHGVGLFKTLTSRVSYSGQWAHGKRHGRGIMYYGEHSWYKGDWVDSIRHGWGVRRFTTGNVYEGQWSRGKRHGEGTMRWLTSNESYTGQWKNGIQHGCGTHTWYLQRVPGSQYPLRNEYIGDFNASLRHGRGKFFFASGAVYSGEWESNKKHGWGKFIFKNGRVFEGKFENDHMVELPPEEFQADSGGDAAVAMAAAAAAMAERCEAGEKTKAEPDEPPDQAVLNMSMFGPGVALDLGFILKDFQPDEHIEVMQQLSFLLLRNVSFLRRVYSFYSALGHGRSPDNTFVMTRFQFWRFLKDCKIHHHQYTLSNIDCLLSPGVGPLIKDIHNPMEKILLREFLNSLVVLSYVIFKEQEGKKTKEGKISVLSRCFRCLLERHILRNACHVGGRVLYEPQHAIVALTYMDRFWQIYQLSCRPRTKQPFDHILTLRHFLFLLKDLRVIGKQLSTQQVFDILAADDPAVIVENNFNVGLELTFLDFFEALVGCALMYEEEEPCVLAEHEEEHRGYTISDSMSSERGADDQDSFSGGGSATNREAESAFDLSLPGAAAPRGGTGEFLQTLSQLTLHDEVGNAVEEGSEAERDAESSPVSKEQVEFNEWNRKLSCFAGGVFFPRWEHLQLLKNETAKYRGDQFEKERLERLRLKLQKRISCDSEPPKEETSEAPEETADASQEGGGGANALSIDPSSMLEMEHQSPEAKPEPNSPSAAKRKQGQGKKKKK